MTEAGGTPFCSLFKSDFPNCLSPPGCPVQPLFCTLPPTYPLVTCAWSSGAESRVGLLPLTVDPVQHPEQDPVVAQDAGWHGPL